MKATQIFEEFLPCTLALTLALCFSGAALANPANPTVVAGQAAFSTAGNALTVTNSPNTIINWQGFSIGPGELTRFVQQSAASAVLNRVTGMDPSRILGTLQSNGRVFLINPNGIAFGAGSRIDVGGLVASTLNLSNADFLSGRLDFTEHPGAGGIANEGEVRAAQSGQILLIAPQVENSGLIAAPNGEVLLAAGKSVRLVDIANPEIQYEVNAPENAAVNLGSLTGRSIGLHGGAIRHSGNVSADSVGIDEAGRIVFRAAGETRIDGGTVTAMSTAGRAAIVEVLGLALTGESAARCFRRARRRHSVGRRHFEGEIRRCKRAGREYLGRIPRFASMPRRPATAAGVDNGRMMRRGRGAISARGATTSGDGGFVEVSGRHYLDFS
ncbi:MAG: filamentous hemagglutinin N-terminal domain-containing protein [Rhodocyclaceae bacterium]